MDGKLVQPVSSMGYDSTKPATGAILELVRSTHAPENPFFTMVPHGKRFTVEYKSGFDISHLKIAPAVDGIGTKGYIHWLRDTLENGAQDALAMVLNDLAEGGYTPVFLRNHIQIENDDDQKKLRIVDALAKICCKYSWSTDFSHMPSSLNKSFPIAIEGGETAVLYTIKGFDIGTNATGWVTKGFEVNKAARFDDVLIGIESNGVHSNGLTFLADEFIIKRGPSPNLRVNLNQEMPWGAVLGDDLTRPTHIYTDAIKDLLSITRVTGMVNITGGGLSKLKELVPAGQNELQLVVRKDHSLAPQGIFKYSSERFGVSSQDMYRRFNCGIGFVVAVSKAEAGPALARLNSHFKADIIGSVGLKAPEEPTVKIHSQFDGTVVEYN